MTNDENLFRSQFGIIITLLIFLGFNEQGYAQTNPAYNDGEIYIRVHDTSSVIIDYNSPSPEMEHMIIKYQIISIQPAFKTPDPLLQKIYKVKFLDIMGVDSLLSDLAGMNYLEYSEKSPRYTLNYFPNDLVTSQQWSLQKIDAQGAWNYSRGNTSVKVAIIDNGINILHDDLNANIWVNPGEIPNNNLDDDLNGFIDDVNGYDVADMDSDPRPPLSATNSSPFIHGTHCAGIASAATDNNRGIASIGFKVKVIAVKAAKNNSTGESLVNAYEGLDYAISAGADIVSMSFGSPESSFTWQYLVNVATIRGIVLVASAGNDNSSSPNYPAAYSNVISVGATDQQDHKATFSNYGNTIDVMAPGVGIYSTVISGYGSLSGTSMSCPMVAGLAALIVSMNGTLTPAEITNYIKNGCVSISAVNPSYQGMLGAGRINAALTLQPLDSGIIPDFESGPLLIYPNPGNGDFEIQSAVEINESFTLEIIDAQGRIIFSEKYSNDIHFRPLRIIAPPDLRYGYYVIRIRTEKESWSVKYVISS
jgi:serine protease